MNCTPKTKIPINKKPCKFTNQESKVENQGQWEIWEWDGSEQHEALIQDECGEYCFFEDIPQMVKKEISRIHVDIGEETADYERFVQENQDSVSAAKHVLYNLPESEDVAPDHFRLMKSCNGDIVYGLTAWKKGKNPDCWD